MNLDEAPKWGDSLQLSDSQKFEIESMNRTVDQCNNLEELKSLSKSLISAFMSQKVATAWALRQSLESNHEKRTY